MGHPFFRRHDHFPNVALMFSVGMVHYFSSRFNFYFSLNLFLLVQGGTLGEGLKIKTFPLRQWFALKSLDFVLLILFCPSLL
jgi:hypothetical protein